MDYEIERSEVLATLKLEFSDWEFNAALADAYWTTMQGKTVLPDEVFLRFAVLMEKHPRNKDFLQMAVEVLLRKGYETIARSESLPLHAVPLITSMFGDVDEGLTLFADVDILSKIAEPVYQGFEVPYYKVIAQDDEVETRLRDARQHYGVSSNAELADRLGAYANEEDMISRMEESLENLVLQMTKESQRKALAEALVENNPVEVSEALVEAHIDDVIGAVREQVGATVFADLFGCEGDRDYEYVRNMIRREEGDAPRLKIVLDSIADNLCLEPHDDGRLSVLELQRSRAVSQGDMNDAAVMLKEIKKDVKALALLDEEVKRSMAFDYVAERVEYSCVGTILLDESPPRQARFW